MGALGQEQFDTLRDDIRNEYDEYVSENNKRVLKRVGLATGIGLSVIALARYRPITWA